MFNAKFAIPVPVESCGVPVMVYTNVPAPFAKVPGERVAVRPYTPVDVMVCPLCVPPLPPVYGTLLLTPLAATPRVKAPMLVAVAQLNAVMLAEGNTVLVKVQVWPPMLKTKLAIPELAGVPLIVYVKLPAPEARVLAAQVAVRPLTPVEVTVWTPRYPPFPPV